MRTALVAGIFAACASATMGADQITNPNWSRIPSGEDLQAVWPIEAARQGVGGKATIRCMVNVKGILEGCAVLSEDPPGYDFGAAAILLSKQFVMKPKTVNGTPVAGTVTIPIHFDTPSSGMGNYADKMFTDPIWSHAPTPKEMADAFPKRAVGSGASGHVVLRCEATGKGALTSCDTLTEIPKHLGFSEAAHSLTDRFRLSPPSDPKAQMGGAYVDVPVEFTDQSTAPTAPRYISHPRWVRTIDPAKVIEAYPEKAAQAGVITGRGTVDCTIDAQGRLTACTSIREEPAGFDFGPSAVIVASVLSINPWTTEGSPAEGAHLRLPIRFNLHPDDPGPPAAPPLK